jgi:hypothetical protein
MPRVSQVLTSVVEGNTSDAAGMSNTSSNVKASRANLSSQSIVTTASNTRIGPKIFSSSYDEAKNASIGGIMNYEL